MGDLWEEHVLFAKLMVEAVLMHMSVIFVVSSTHGWARAARGKVAIAAKIPTLF